MKRKIKPTRQSISKRPNDQKLIETFLLLNQAKTIIKSNNDKENNNNKKPKEEIKNEENKITHNIIKDEIDLIQRQNELKLINGGIFFEQDNKKLIEEIKTTNPELYKKVTIEEEMIFPIMIDTNLGVYKELLSNKIEEILNKINTKDDIKWVEAIPIIDVSIVKLKIKDPNDINNFIILGFVTKAISYKLYLLSLNNIISIKIYINKNGRRLAILVGLNYDKYSIKVDFTDEQKKMYKLHFKSDLVLGNDVYKLLKELKMKYAPPEMFKNDFMNLIYNNVEENNKKKSLKENYDESTIDDENSSENNSDGEKRKNLADYLVNNVEKILSMTISYDNLFDEKEKNYFNIFMNLNSEEKTVLLKFLRRKNRWQNVNKLFNNEINDTNNIIIEHLDIILISLLEKKLISNFQEIIGNFKNLNNNKLFEYLYYLSTDDLRKINTELNKICKNLNSSKDINQIILSPYVKESFINNPFYNLNIFISPDEENESFFEKIILNTSEKITKFNFNEELIAKSKSKKEVAFNPILLNTKINKNSNYNNQYINTFLNYSNFKSIHLSNNVITGNKIKLINSIITSINIYLKEKRSSFLENFVIKNESNNNSKNILNSKEKNLEKIFENYNAMLFCVNENFARIMDITSRLFFFYTDCKDLNDIGREFYEIERYEQYNYHSNDERNKIFKDKNIFNLYDTLYQIKNSYLIFSMFNSNEMKYPTFFYELLLPLIPFLLKVTNNELYGQFFNKKDFDIIGMKNEDIDILNDTLTKNLLKNFESSNDFFNLNEIKENNDNNNSININYNKISFVDKYKPEYISSQMLYYFILNLERNKKFALANLIYIYLLNCFHNSFILKQRGFIYHRIILNYSFHLKNNKSAIEILNICIKYDIMKYKIIKNGELFKIKTYYDKLNKQKNNTKNKGNNKILNLLIPYSFKEINDNFDIKNIMKEIEADSLYSSSSGRRKYNLTDDKFSETATVEEFALNYYLKQDNYRGVHGENVVIPALYFLLLWEEIYDDEVPLVFQSKYQAFPLDFFEKDFYINRKSKLDNKLEKIQKYKKEQLINHIKTTYETKNGIKNPCVEWNSYIYNEEILIKIGIAFGPQKLVEIFRVILTQGLKSVKTGMPDLFLWKENGKSKYKEKFYYAEIDSIKLVEVKSVNDKLSDNQKFWLKTFCENGINVEVLHIK